MGVMATMKKNVTLKVSIDRPLLELVTAYAKADKRSIPNALVYAASIALRSGYLRMEPPEPEGPGDHRIIAFPEREA
jgi:hypothetical protein